MRSRQDECEGAAAELGLVSPAHRCSTRGSTARRSCPHLIAFVAADVLAGADPGPSRTGLNPRVRGRATAARIARSIVSLAPAREPGSEGDAAVADLVRERFAAIEGGELAVQNFESTFGGEDVELRTSS